MVSQKYNKVYNENVYDSDKRGNLAYECGLI